MSVQDVLARLKYLAADFDQPHELGKLTEEIFTNDITTMLDAGWTELEVYRYLSNTEEINPYLGEEFALRRMKIISDRVKLRLSNG